MDDELTVGDLMADYEPSGSTETETILEEPMEPTATQAETEQTIEEITNENPVAETPEGEEVTEGIQAPERSGDEILAPFYNEDGTFNADSYVSKVVNREETPYVRPEVEAPEAVEQTIDQAQASKTQYERHLQNATYGMNRMGEYLAAGYTAEQAQQAVKSEIDASLWKLQQEETVASYKDEIKAELEALRAEKEMAQIEPRAQQNINKVAAPFGGTEKFFNFINEYAGQSILRSFDHENPDKVHLQGDELTAEMNTWFTKRSQSEHFLNDVVDIANAKLQKKMWPQMRKMIGKTAVTDSNQRGKAKREPRSVARSSATSQDAGLWAGIAGDQML